MSQENEHLNEKINLDKMRNNGQQVKNQQP